jgi:signal transduction histidine kinase
VKVNATVSPAEAFELRIEDDGHGFDEAGARKNSGRGVANIRGRASMIAADASWHKRAGGGTVFELRLPQNAKPAI